MTGLGATAGVAGVAGPAIALLPGRAVDSLGMSAGAPCCNGAASFR